MRKQKPTYFCAKKRSKELRRNSNRKHHGDVKNKQTNEPAWWREPPRVSLQTIAKPKTKRTTQVAAIFASLAEWDIVVSQKKRKERKSQETKVYEKNKQKDQSNPFVVV